MDSKISRDGAGAVSYDLTTYGASWEEVSLLDPWYYSPGCGTLDHCNTEVYAAEVNQAGLCGASDWRLPNDQELQSIVDYGRSLPSIDTAYFPKTVSAGFWSSTPYANYSNYAWIVNFSNGYVYDGYQCSNYSVRLVRGGQ